MLRIISTQNLIREKETPNLSILDSTPPLLERLKLQAVLDLKEICQLREFLNTGVSLKLFLKNIKATWGEELISKIADFSSQLAAINRVVTANQEISEDASPLLKSLCDERRKLSKDISKLFDQIITRRQMESVLQDKYVTNREGRMVIPVKSGNQHDLKGLIHDSSQTKLTVFMEPEEAVPLNNRLREVQIEIQEEILRILKELSDYLAKSLTAFRNADQVFLDCDGLFAKARLNEKIDGIEIKFSKDEFILNNLKHPLLQLQGVKVVANTVRFKNDKRILLLSGPNAGGKTILLKAAGLAVQMARTGLPVPVSEGSRLPFFENIDAIVGDLQSVDQNLSSFSSHITRLNKSLMHKNSTSLVLVDEICGSTDPEEGAALARSYIEQFEKNKIYAVVTSHLGPLKESWEATSAIEHGSLEFNSKTGTPTYQLLMGFPGQSLALSVASRLNAPSHIIERARSLLSPESLSRSQELEEIEKLKGQIVELKNETQKERDEAHQAKKLYTDLINKFREQRDKWLEKSLQKAEKKIEGLIEEARQDRIRNMTLQDIKSQLPEIVKARAGGSASKINSIDDFKVNLKPGTQAYASRLGRQVIIQSEPDNKGMVSVLSDSMRIQLPWHSLQPIGAAGNEQKPLQQVVRRSGASQATEVSENIELDLRGHRVDEALTKLDKWLDIQIRGQNDRVKVVHGFGTEQLKKSIRQYLSKSPYVGKWTSGDQTSGGDGVTWIYLSDQ